MKTLLFIFNFFFLCFSTQSWGWTGKELQSSKSLKLTVFAPHSNHQQGLILEKSSFKGRTVYFISELNLNVQARPHLVNEPAFQEIYQNLRKTYLSAKWKEPLSPLCSSSFNIDRQVNGFTYHQSLCEDLLPKHHLAELNQWYRNTLSLIRM